MRFPGIGRTVMTAFVVMPTPLSLPNSPDRMLAVAVHDGDAAFHAFDNETARLCYQCAYDIDSTDCDVLWKLARRCVALYPDSTEAHFFLAVAIGQLTKVVGGSRRIELSKDVQREAETTLSLDPQHAGAMHILGRWNYEIASLGWFSKMAAKVVYGGVPPGASYEEAITWFERAIAIRPEMPLNHLWLGETLIKIHDYPRAREELQTCLDLEDVLWDDSLTKAQARKTLREIEGKD